MTAKIISVASSKGGIGKSTVSLGIAEALARAGCKTLLVDLDFGNACLDLLLGVEDNVLFSISDVANGACSVEPAVVRTDRKNLWLLPAPSGGKGICPEKEKLGKLIEAAAESVSAGYVIIDTGAGVNAAADAVFSQSDVALVVASHSPVSVRAAENTAQRIRDFGALDVKLIINSFDTGDMLRKSLKSRTGMFDIIDESGIELLGVVPYDYELQLYAENPEMGYTKETAAAFDNIALRLEGQSIPLFSGMKKIRRKKKILFS